MAEEIVAEPDYEKICSSISNCNEHVRFAGFVNDKSQILFSSQKDDLDSLLNKNEIGMSIQ